MTTNRPGKPGPGRALYQTKKPGGSPGNGLTAMPIEARKFFLRLFGAFFGAALAGGALAYAWKHFI